jgi:uncharacterized protein YqeY
MLHFAIKNIQEENTMSMELQIQQDIKAAMLAKEKTRLESLRAIKAAILLAKAADGSESIADEAVVKIIQKLVKQRKETAEIYKQQNREELAAQELAEAATMEVYLPKQLSEAEIEEELKKIIAQVGATGPQDMGKVMGTATKALAGKAEGRVISTLVKKLLQ